MTTAEVAVLRDLYRKTKAQLTPTSARELLQVGDSSRLSQLSQTELAALMTLARAILNLHGTVTRN